MTRGDFAVAGLSTFVLVAGCNLVLGNEEGVLVEAGFNAAPGGGAPGGGGAVAQAQGGASSTPRSEAGGGQLGTSLGSGGVDALGNAGENAGSVAGADDGEPIGAAGSAGDSGEGGSAGNSDSAPPDATGGTGASPGNGGTAGVAGSETTPGATGGTGGSGGVAGGASGGDASSASGGGPVCECTPGSPPTEEIVPCPKGAYRTRTRACNDDCTLAPPVDSECVPPPNDCDGCSCVNFCKNSKTGGTPTCLWIDCTFEEAKAECLLEVPQVCGQGAPAPPDPTDWRPR